MQQNLFISANSFVQHAGVAVLRDGTAASAHADRAEKAVPALVDMSWSYAQNAGAE